MNSPPPCHLAKPKFFCNKEVTGGGYVKECSSLNTTPNDFATMILGVLLSTIVGHINVTPKVFLFCCFVIEQLGEVPYKRYLPKKKQSA